MSSIRATPRWAEHRFPPEQRLWLNVLSIALGDALGEPSAISSFNRASVQREAITWFTDAGRDFRFVCHCAGLEPECVRKSTLALIEQRNQPNGAETCSTTQSRTISS